MIRELGKNLGDRFGAQRSKEEKMYCLLIIQSSIGHTTIDFIECCINFDTIVAILYSDLAHILQLREVGVTHSLRCSQEMILQQTSLA